MWIVYALLSALFASLTAICAKIGVKDIDSNLATAIRTTVILLLTWGIVFFQVIFHKSRPCRVIRGFSLSFPEYRRDCHGSSISRQSSSATCRGWLLLIS